MYFYRYFQIDLLIKIFILLRQAEVITWENFILVKRDPAVQKRDPVLSGWNFLHVIAGCNLWRVYNTARIRWHDVQWIVKISGKYLIISDILSGIWKSTISIPEQCPPKLIVSTCKAFFMHLCICVYSMQTINFISPSLLEVLQRYCKLILGNLVCLAMATKMDGISL